MSAPTAVVVLGTSAEKPPPGLERLAGEATFRFADDAAALAAELPEAEVLFGWDYRADLLSRAWAQARRLRWVQWPGAGVDRVLFPELAASDVVLTNARGIYDQAMAEYCLGLVLAMVKGLPETLAAQREHRWNYRLSERLAGRRALVVGTGSIGRAIGRLLAAVGMEVAGVARRARAGHSVFGRIEPVERLREVLPAADFVINVAPATPATQGLFGQRELAAMKPGARFINLGRGSALDEGALVAALERGHLAGAALDVFAEEPLPEDSPLWDAPNLICSPHMSGDYRGFEEALVELFADNLRRYRAGEPLRNVVDKRLGYVPG